MRSDRHARFRFRDLDDLRETIAGLGADVPVSEDLAVLGEPLALAGRTLPNRFTVQPMEGFDAEPDGAPGELTFRRYLRYAEGGFGLIWAEATAVLEEARSNPAQLWLHKGNMARFRDLVADTRRAARRAFGHDVMLVLQLTHSGRYSKPHGTPRPLIAHHNPHLDPLHRLSADYPLVSDEYLDRLGDAYIEAARCAADAGFDGVDIKSCHRYLVSELLASFTRPGRYGGSFENRARLLLETLRRVVETVPSVFPTTRMNAFDALPHPYGFGASRDGTGRPDPREPAALAGALADLGAPMLNVSAGNPYVNPHYGRPYDLPIRGAPLPGEHPLVGVARLIALAAAVQRAVPAVPVVGAGYSWLRHFMPNVAAAVIRRGDAALFGIGRGAFAYPDTPRDVLTAGRMDPDRCCVACSACTQIMRDGGHTGCVVRDAAIYGPEYRRGLQSAADPFLEAGARRRDGRTNEAGNTAPSSDAGKETPQQ